MAILFFCFCEILLGIIYRTLWVSEHVCLCFFVISERDISPFVGAETALKFQFVETVGHYSMS